MRLCYPNGTLAFNYKGPLSSHPAHLIPWFQLPERLTKNQNVVFGHWAALSGITHTAHVYALDTGCVWGYSLTAMRLEDKKRFSIENSKE